MAEQRSRAVLAVVADGRTVKEVASDWGVSRQTVHSWLARYEAEGLEGLANRSHRPALVRAQQALEEWVTYCNTERPYQSLGDATLASRFQEAAASPRRLAMRAERTSERWVCRTVARNGLVCVDYQQISVGRHFGASPCDLLVSDTTLQLWVGNELLMDPQSAHCDA